MFARVARYAVPEDRSETAVERVDQAIDTIQSFDGFIRAYVLVDEERGDLFTVTLWASLAALEASEVRAALLRKAATQAVGGSVEWVRKYSVARTVD
jgi:heme-degrading monooxygenase HmoA